MILGPLPHSKNIKGLRGWRLGERRGFCEVLFEESCCNDVSYPPRGRKGMPVSHLKHCERSQQRHLWSLKFRDHGELMPDSGSRNPGVDEIEGWAALTAGQGDGLLHWMSLASPAQGQKIHEWFSWTKGGPLGQRHGLQSFSTLSKETFGGGGSWRNQKHPLYHTHPIPSTSELASLAISESWWMGEKSSVWVKNEKLLIYWSKHSNFWIEALFYDFK